MVKNIFGFLFVFLFLFGTAEAVSAKEEALEAIREAESKLVEVEGLLDEITSGDIYENGELMEVSVREITDKFEVSRHSLNEAVRKYQSEDYGWAVVFANHSKRNALLLDSYLKALIGQAADLGLVGLLLQEGIDKLIGIRSDFEEDLEDLEEIIGGSEDDEEEIEEPADDDEDEELIEEPVNDDEDEEEIEEPADDDEDEEEIEEPADDDTEAEESTDDEGFENCLTQREEDCLQEFNICVDNIPDRKAQCQQVFEQNKESCQVFAERIDSIYNRCQTIAARCEDRRGLARLACRARVVLCQTVAGVRSYILRIRLNNCQNSLDRSLDRCLEQAENDHEGQFSNCRTRQETCLNQVESVCRDQFLN
ncbi:MAG: hypothetical protein ACOCU8_02360 [Patescibacteria group bacterium]